MTTAGVPHPRWAALLAAWAFFAALFTLWALATPIGAAPDEPAHVIKAASVVRGQVIGEPLDFGHEVQVPSYIADTHAQTCFAFHVDRSADCPVTLKGDPAALIDSTTTAGLYNPVYYALVGWPSLIFDDEAGIYAMRIMNALIMSALIGLAFMMVAGWRRRVLPLLGLFAAATPMVVFLGGVVNPSGPEIAGTLSAVVAVTTIVLRRDVAFLRGQCIAMSIGSIVAVNMRGISPLWIAVGLGVPLFVLGWRAFLGLLRTPSVRLAIAAIIAAAVFATAWTMVSNSLSAGMTDGRADALFRGVGTPPVAGFIEMVLSTFDFARGLVGEFGWTDTPAPSFTFFFWSALTGGLLAFCLVALRGRQLVVVVVLVGATVILPAAVQAAYVTDGGYIWQGRYTIPMFAALVFIAAALLDERLGERFEATLARRMLAILSAVWAFAQFDAFLRVLRRYAEGWPSGWGEFLRTPDWSPPGGTIVLPVAFAVLATTVAIWLQLMARSSLQDVVADEGGPRRSGLQSEIEPERAQPRR